MTQLIVIIITGAVKRIIKQTVLVLSYSYKVFRYVMSDSCIT